MLIRKIYMQTHGVFLIAQVKNSCRMTFVRKTVTLEQHKLKTYWVIKMAKKINALANVEKIKNNLRTNAC